MCDIHSSLILLLRHKYPGFDTLSSWARERASERENWWSKRREWNTLNCVSRPNWIFHTMCSCPSHRSIGNVRSFPRDIQIQPKFIRFSPFSVFYWIAKIKRESRNRRLVVIIVIVITYYYYHPVSCTPRARFTWLSASAWHANCKLQTIFRTHWTASCFSVAHLNCAFSLCLWLGRLVYCYCFAHHWVHWIDISWHKPFVPNQWMHQCESAQLQLVSVFVWRTVGNIRIETKIIGQSACKTLVLRIRCTMLVWLNSIEFHWLAFGCIRWTM